MTRTADSLGRADVEKLLTAMKSTRVVVVGDVMLDRYLYGDADRISAEAPVAVVNVTDETSAPGGAANVAANLKAFGARASLVGVVGDDPDGHHLTDLLAAADVDISGVHTISGRPTTAKTRIVARGQQIVRIDREVTTPLPAARREAVIRAATGALQQADALIIEDYDKGVLDQELAATLINIAMELDLPVVIDPKLRLFHSYRGATLFKPNRRELEMALAAPVALEDGDLIDARRRLSVENLLVTLGPEGMVLVDSNDAITAIPSVAREVFDVSGAGDTVSAWAAAALAAGADVITAAWLANLAAGVQVGKRGTATVAPHEVLLSWEEQYGD